MKAPVVALAAVLALALTGCANPEADAARARCVESVDLGMQWALAEAGTLSDAQFAAVSDLYAEKVAACEALSDSEALSR